MPKVNLTVRFVEAIKPPTTVAQEDYWDEGLTGFGVRVSKEGKKSWFVKYRLGSRRPRVTFGVYPILGLADARRQAQAILNEAAQGVDVSAQKRAQRLAETVQDLGELYLERHAKLNKKSWEEDQRILQREVFPKWGSRKATELARRDVIALLDAIVARGSPIQANRTLALVRKVFNFGIQRDLLEINPCYQVSRPAEESARERVLTLDEIRTVWLATDRLDTLVGDIFRLCILTAQRGAEVRSMAWADLDLEAGWWTIPGERTKNGLTHRVPLTAQSIEIVRRRAQERDKSPWVFPSPTAHGQHVDNVQKAIQRLRAATGVDFVGHDFRRTAASHMASLGIPRLVISKVLNHVEAGITRVYDRHSYDREKREALEAWGKQVQEVLKIDVVQCEGLTRVLREASPAAEVTCG